MRTAVMADAPEQRSLAFRRPARQSHPLDTCTHSRIDGCNGAPFETISRSLLLCGDASRALDLLPDECVQTVLTSPPYWSLRDYLKPSFVDLIERRLHAVSRSSRSETRSMNFQPAAHA